MNAPCCFRPCCNFSTAMSRGIVLPESANAAAAPAASPIAKQAPETRAADWPSWVIEAQRPAISRLSMPSGTSMRYGNSLKPRDCGIGGEGNVTAPAASCSLRQPLAPVGYPDDAQPGTAPPPPQ